MGCKKLYLESMEALACTASVVACTPREDGGFDVETDRTTLFPEGGGQRSDTGMMDGARCPADCRTAAKRLCESLGAKGGGSEKAAQGSFEYGGAHGALLEKIGEVLADGCLAP